MPLMFYLDIRRLVTVSCSWKCLKINAMHIQSSAHDYETDKDEVAKIMSRAPRIRKSSS